MKSVRVGIIIYEDVEVLDFCGPFEVFSVARLNEDKRREEPSPFQPFLVAESAGLVTATGGMQVLANHSMADCPHFEILVVPGGWGFRHHMQNASLHAWLRDRAAKADTVTAVCTGSLLLLCGNSGWLGRHNALAFSGLNARYVPGGQGPV